MRHLEIFYVQFFVDPEKLRGLVTQYYWHASKSVYTYLWLWKASFQKKASANILTIQ